MLAGGQNYYFHEDSLGSVRNITTAGGQTEWTYSYEPFGTARTETKNDTMAPDNTVRFAGELLDADAGLYDLRARMYAPAEGRFLSVDPRPASSETPFEASYAYAAGNPVRFLDPSGLGPVYPRSGDWTWAGVLAAVAARMDNDCIPDHLPPASGAVLQAWIFGYETTCRALRERQRKNICERGAKWAIIGLAAVAGGEELIVGGAILRGVAGELTTVRTLSGWASFFGTTDALGGLAQGTLRGVLGLGLLGVGGWCAAQ